MVAIEQVTGASSGIGLAIARRFAAEGATVHLTLYLAGGHSTFTTGAELLADGAAIPL